MTEPKRRSYSAMTTYLECGEKYRLKYVERHAEDPAIWSIGGTAFHSCAEAHLRGELDGVLPDLWAHHWHAAKQELLDKGADPDLATWRAAGRGREDAAWWAAEGPQMVARFIDWWDGRAEQLNVLQLAGLGPALEHRIEVDLGGVPIVAIPDAVVVDEHGQINILDYKSGRRAPSGALQLSVYRSALLAQYGMPTSWGLYYMTRRGEAIPYDLTRGHSHDQIVDMFGEFDSKERAGIYRPNPGPACRFCGVRDHCAYKETA